MKRLRNTFLLAALLTQVLALVALPVPASGQQSTPIVSTPIAPPQTVEGDPQPYIVRGIATKEQRSIIHRTYANDAFHTLSIIFRPQGEK